MKTIMVKLKHPSKRKHKMWVEEQIEYAKTVNACVLRLSIGEKLSSKNVHANLKSAIKNEAIRKTRKAISDVKKGWWNLSRFFDILSGYPLTTKIGTPLVKMTDGIFRFVPMKRK